MTSGPARTRRLDRGVVLAATGAALLVLAGCGEFNVRKELGLVGQGPDEFRVLKQGQLEMPSDMSQLPAPQPGVRDRVAPDPIRDAQQALAGGPILSTGAAASGAEAELLRAAGASSADPSIRAAIEADVEDSKADIRLLDGLLGRDRLADGQLLDPAEEAARLADEARQGKNPDLEPLPVPETN